MLHRVCGTGTKPVMQKLPLRTSASMIQSQKLQQSGAERNKDGQVAKCQGTETKGDNTQKPDAGALRMLEQTFLRTGNSVEEDILRTLDNPPEKRRLARALDMVYHNVQQVREAEVTDGCFDQQVLQQGLHKWADLFAMLVERSHISIEAGKLNTLKAFTPPGGQPSTLDFPVGTVYEIVDHELGPILKYTRTLRADPGEDVCILLWTFNSKGEPPANVTSGCKYVISCDVDSSPQPDQSPAPDVKDVKGQSLLDFLGWFLVELVSLFVAGLVLCFAIFVIFHR